MRTMAQKRTKKEWMALYGTPAAPGPKETGWKGFSYPTRKQWAALYYQGNEELPKTHKHEMD